MHANRMRLRVALLCGGDSLQREVSLASGVRAARALSDAGHVIQIFDPSRTPIESIPWYRYDLAFLALHGGSGEDGQIQQALHQRGVIYTGSGPTASRLAISKSASKERFRLCGVPTLRYVLVERGTSACQQVLDWAATEASFPLAIKPDSQGSSLGVRRVDSAAALPAAVAEAGIFDRFLLAEPWIDGTHLTVLVLGRRTLSAIESSPPCEECDCCDEESPREPVAASLPASLDENVRHIAVQAARAVGTRGLCSVDIVVDADGQPWTLEINTIPSLAVSSLTARAAQAASFDLPALCHWMVADAMRLRVRS